MTIPVSSSVQYRDGRELNHIAYWRQVLRGDSKMPMRLGSQVLTIRRGLPALGESHRGLVVLAPNIGRFSQDNRRKGRVAKTSLGYCARQLDIRAIKKFGLPTIVPLPSETLIQPPNRR